MNLNVKINEKIYKNNVPEGFSVSEEYNETLDSATLKLGHIPMIYGLKPYDDVYVWDAQYEFIGFDKDILYMSKNGKEINFQYDYIDRQFKYNNQSIFYKHFLIDTFSETMINLKDLKIKNKGVGNYEPLYEYTIQLFSETKGLETVQLPNISITEPLNYTYKLSCWDYFNKYINLYSPIYKKVNDSTNKIWEFEKKYSLSESLKPFFENSYSPDFTLNNPNLRDVLSKFMIVKDMIPYVVNNVIYALDITKRGKEFEISDGINYVSSSMSSGDYCDNLKKTYSNALSKENTARSIEYIGFRNNNNALMTLGNMQLETRFPIYKINKIYMCYYKRINKRLSNGNLEEKVFLCKQDITPLVKLNAERNALSKDWNDFANNADIDIDNLSRYRMMTVGYDIGSNIISGWGEMYTYPIETTFWDIKKTYIENIFDKLDTYYPFGIYGIQHIQDLFGKDGVYYNNSISPISNIVTGYNINNPLKLKTLLFEIDYQGFYNGTVIHTKDNGRDNITVNDNPSSSLTLLEQDGLLTKEKANRFGNKSMTINARYKSIDEIQPLGSVFYDVETGDNDIIIYHREYQIWDNYIQVVYYGIHDYVLKNYFTSVFARHRTWNLMSYGESVRRAENRRMMVLLSTDSAYYESFDDEDSANQKFNIVNINPSYDIFSLIFSAFISSSDPKGVNLLENENKLNYAYIYYEDKDHKNSQYYLSDLNSFVSGNSMCLNVSMSDNITGGNYIKSFRPKFNKKLEEQSSDNWFNYILYTKVKDDYTGSVQGWEKSCNDYGFAHRMGFYLGHYDNNLEDVSLDPSQVDSLYKNVFFKIPYINQVDDNLITNKIGRTYNIYKDNKEVIDMTYQIEPITTDNNIKFSSLFMQLSDIISNSNKFKEDYSYDEGQLISGDIQTYFGEYYKYVYSAHKFDKEAERRPYFVIKISKEIFKLMVEACDNSKKDIEIKNVSIIYKLNKNLNISNYPQCVYEYKLDILSTKCFFDKNIEKAVMKLSIKEEIAKSPANEKRWTQYRDIVVNDTTYFNLDNKLSDKNFSDSDKYYYFMYSEYPMKFEDSPNAAKDYISFIGQIDWQTPQGNVGSRYEINSVYSEKNANQVLNEKCLGIPSLISSEFYKKYFKFRKNMYVVTSKNKLYNDIIYDKYGWAEDYDEKYSSYSIGNIVKYNNKAYINVKEITFPETFNPSKWEEIQGAKFKDNENLYKITNDANYWDNIDLSFEDLDVDKVFSVKKDANGISYIKVDLSLFKGDTPKSIQYWYNDNGNLSFVFGINVPDNIENNEIKIYLSALSTRDMRVYDDKHNLVGESLNFVKEGQKVDDKQHYKPKEKEQ